MEGMPLALPIMATPLAKISDPLGLWQANINCQHSICLLAIRGALGTMVQDSALASALWERVRTLSQCPSHSLCTHSLST